MSYVITYERGMHIDPQSHACIIVVSGSVRISLAEPNNRSKVLTWARERSNIISRTFVWLPYTNFKNYKAIWTLRVKVASDIPYPLKWWHLFLPTLGSPITHLFSFLLASFFSSVWNYFEDDVLTSLLILETSHTHLDPSLFPSSETSLMSHLTTIRLLTNI